MAQMAMTTKQVEALRRSYTGESDGRAWYWPTGHDVLVLRAMARRGELEETTGACEGCRSHRPGQAVPVFSREVAS